MSDDDVARILHRRSAILSFLVGQALEKRTLESRVDASRSTIDRGIRELEAVGLVERTADGYAATLAGRLAAESRAQYAAELDGIDRSSQLLDALDAEADVDRAMLAGADVERTTQPSTSAPLNRVKALVRRSDRYRGLSAVDSGTGFGTLFHEQVVGEGLDLSFVFTDAMADHLESRLSDEVAEMYDAGFEMGTVESLPYGLGVGYGDDWAEAALLVYGPGSRLVGIVFNDDPAAVDWAASVYDRVREKAKARSP